MQQCHQPRINRIRRRQDHNRERMIATDAPQRRQCRAQHKLQHDADVVQRGDEVEEVLRSAARAYDVAVETGGEAARGPER